MSSTTTNSYYNRLLEDDNNDSDDTMIIDLHVLNNEQNSVNITKNKKNTKKQLSYYIPSPSVRHEIFNNIILRIMIITILSGIGISYIALGFQETFSMNGENILNTNIEYSYYYLYILLMFYGCFIFLNISSIIILYYYAISHNVILRFLQLNAQFFQLSNILRLIFIIIIIIKIIENTAMTSFNIISVYNKTIILPSYIKLSDNQIISVFIPKYFQYIIIEFVINGISLYLIGIYNGMIKLFLH